MTAANTIPFTREPVFSPGTAGARETASAASPPVAAEATPIYRVFWHCAGEPVFRDHTGRIRPVHIIRLRCVRHALWRMAREARGDERTRLCTIYAEASEALADTMAWRMAAVR